MTVEKKETNQTEPTKALPSLSEELAALVESSSSTESFIESAFTCVSHRLSALCALMELQVNGRNVTRQYSTQDVAPEQLIDLAYALSVEAQMDAKSRAKFLTSEFGTVVVVSCPLTNAAEESTYGAMTWFAKTNDEQSAQKQAKVIGQIAKLINAGAEVLAERLADKEKTSDVGQQQQVKALLNASNFENITALCYTLVNSYCQKLNCQKTAIGLVNNNQVKVNSVSGIDSIVENSPAIVQIQQAQEECLDFGQRVIVQQIANDEDNVTSDGLLIHKRWHQADGGASVASIPIRVDGEFVAVLSLERKAPTPFKDDELDKIEKTVQAFGPAIELMKKSSRSLRQHAKDSLSQNFLARFKNKTFAIAASVALAFLVFGWLPYRPTIPCTIQPAKINHLTAPFDGVIASAPFFAGDQIKAGDAMIQFDTRELELERDAIAAQINSGTIARNQALQQRNQSEAAVIEAQVQSDRVRLQSVERKIAQGSMKAQYEGTVIRGDLRHQIGQAIPQGTPLMEIAPLGGMRIQMEIPEEKAGLIEVGYEGSFSAGSQPSDRHEFKITKITPSTTVRNGKNVLLAEAEVTGESEWMRTGMTGYANVKAGWQPVWWMVSHRVIDRLRLGFWL